MLVMVSFMACPFRSEVAARAVANLPGVESSGGRGSSSSAMTVPRHCQPYRRRRCDGNFMKFPSDFLATLLGGTSKLRGKFGYLDVADLAQLVGGTFADRYLIREVVVSVVVVLNDFYARENRLQFISEYGHTFKALLSGRT